MSFSFEPFLRPYARWMGPFSPARGTLSGFRFHHGRLGTWVQDTAGREFWSIPDGSGVRALQRLVLDEWGGGRVLFLPNGLVIKPLPGEEERGQRQVLGRFKGPILLEMPNQDLFDLAAPWESEPGSRWHGPRTIGLECVMHSDGSLHCKWYHPAKYGRDEEEHVLLGSSTVRASGFRACRPGQSSGRVRVTANGHIMTNRQKDDGTWVSLYVGWINPEAWGDWDHWIMEQ